MNKRIKKMLGKYEKKRKKKKTIIITKGLGKLKSGKNGSRRVSLPFARLNPR